MQTGEAHYVGGSPDQSFLTIATNSNESLYRAATPDFEHVLLNSWTSLVPGHVASSTSGGELYQLTDSGIRLASIAPDGDPMATADSGQGADFNARSLISEDGRRIFFRGLRTSAEVPAVWMREDATRTVLLSASRRVGEEGELRGGALLDASANGNIAFFVTSAPLLPESEAPDRFDPARIYRYEVETDQLEEIYVGPENSFSIGFGVSLIGLSSDGHNLFFSQATDTKGGETLLHWRLAGGITTVADLEGLGVGLGAIGEQVNLEGSAMAFSTVSLAVPEHRTDPRCVFKVAGSTEPAPPGRCLEAYVYDAREGELAVCLAAQLVGWREALSWAVTTLER